MDTIGLPKTRKEAQTVGAKYYFTGIPCKHGHIAPRKTKGACTTCAKEDDERNKERRAEYFRTYNLREDVKEAKHKWYEENKEQVIAAAKLQPAHLKKQYQAAWKAKNQVWVRADTKNRRRKHRLATPAWLTPMQKREMREIYKAAITTTKLTGVQYVVDHIVPLRGESVCGLHVPWNLVVMTQDENLRKSNKLVDTPPAKE